MNKFNSSFRIGLGIVIILATLPIVIALCLIEMLVQELSENSRTKK